MTDLIGTILSNRYEVLEEIGSGGMAVVYKGRCKLLNRFVAVKVLRDTHRDNEEFLHRFNVESQAAASLSHPNVVPIYDVGSDNGYHYIVMEYVEGETLKEYIDREGQLEWREAVDFAIQICRGLSVAHQNFIIHRDVKPHNIIMTRDKVLKVTDFGIARANNGATMTIAGNAIGSVHYLSPEQARGGYTDEKTDIYSLGIVLYEMTTGTLPFDNESNPVSIAIKHIQENPINPREINMMIPRSLESVILKCISKDQLGRYQSVSAIIRDLERLLRNPEVRIGGIMNDVTSLHEADNSKKGKKDHHDRDFTYRSTIPKYNHVDDNHDLDNEVEVIEEYVPRKAKKQRRAVITAIIASILLIGGIAFAGMYYLYDLGGTNEIAVPDLIGKQLDAMTRQYKDSKWKIVEIQTIANEAEEGTIIEQNPREESFVKDEQEIEIKVTVSKGEEKFFLEHYSNGRTDYRLPVDDLRTKGIRVELIREYSANIPIDCIIEQEPASGTSIKRGDTVTLTVSNGPEEEEEPKVSPSPSPTPNTVVTNTPSPQTPEPPVQQQTLKRTVSFTAPSTGNPSDVVVKVDGNTFYENTHNSGESFNVEITGTKASVKVEVYYNGQLSGTQTLRLE